VSFKWRADEFKDKAFPEGRQYGLIAQDVEKVLPEVVMTSGGEKSIAYAELIPILIEGIKELRAEKDREIAELRETIARLEARK
jgi:hypothetical protein